MVYNFLLKKKQDYEKKVKAVLNAFIKRINQSNQNQINCRYGK